MKKLILSILASAAVLCSGCATDLQTIGPLPPAQAQVNPTVATTQVEFLARPGIGEGLLYSNDLLNFYNSLRPRDVAAVLSAPTGTAADLLNQATGVLVALDELDGDTTNGLSPTQIAGAFLPDVMRIDTTLTFTTDATPSYPTFNSSSSTLVGGRKITDDVIDITLGVLTDNFVTSDGVPYYRPTTGAGSTNQAIGHSRLNGQTVDYGPCQFPYLADPH